MIYTFCTTLLLIGILGLLAQVLLGGAHTGHTGPAGHPCGPGNGPHVGDAHGGHGHGHDVAVAAPDVQGHGVPHGGRAKAGRGSFILTLLSPVVFFSLCIGMGGTGLLIKHFHLPTVIVVFVALAGRRVVALTYGFVN